MVDAVAKGFESIQDISRQIINEVPNLDTVLKSMSVYMRIVMMVMSVVVERETGSPCASPSPSTVP